MKVTLRAYLARTSTQGGPVPPPAPKHTSIPNPDKPRVTPSMEAAQFWALLDETHGADAGAFHINCLEVLEASLGPLHRRRYHGGRLLGIPTEVSTCAAVANAARSVGIKQHKARVRVRLRIEPISIIWHFTMLPVYACDQAPFDELYPQCIRPKYQNSR